MNVVTLRSLLDYLERQPYDPRRDEIRAALMRLYMIDNRLKLDTKKKK